MASIWIVLAMLCGVVIVVIGQAADRLVGLV
jgi:hypothetical protein